MVSLRANICQKCVCICINILTRASSKIDTYINVPRSLTFFFAKLSNLIFKRDYVVAVKVHNKKALMDMNRYRHSQIPEVNIVVYLV